MLSVADVVETQLDKATAAQFAVDGQMKERHVARAPIDSQTLANRPDFANA